MLTLLLVLGTVTCSPVPSDLPVISEGTHIEVTHEVRHVTFEVSEEVNEATASSHISSDVPPEEDPPIPTVTTPHTEPEPRHIQYDFVEGTVATSGALRPTNSFSQKASEDAIKIDENSEQISNIKSTEEKKSDALIEHKVIISQNINDYLRNPEVVESSNTESIALVPDSPIILHNEELNISQPNYSIDSFTDLDINETSIVSEEEKNETSIASEEINGTSIASEENNETSIASDEENNETNSSTSDELNSNEAATNSTSTELIDIFSNASQQECKEIISCESHLNETIKEIPLTKSELNPDLIVLDSVRDILVQEESEIESHRKQTDLEKQSDLIILDSKIDKLNQTENETRIERSDLERKTDLVILDSTLDVASEVNSEKSSEDSSFKDVNDQIDHVSGGELLEEIPAQIIHVSAHSEFLEADKRTDNEDMPVHEHAPAPESSEDSYPIIPVEHIPETTRESRVYIEYDDDSSGDSEEINKPPVFPEEDKSHIQREFKHASSGLESMSMTSTSRTPESLPEDVPEVDSLEKGEAPPAEDQSEEVATISSEMDSQEENSTLITKVEQTDVISGEVINPPSSSVTPFPIDEYTDNYSDPIAGGDLPDFDVTHEQLPPKDYSLPEQAELIPGTHDHVGEINAGEPGDLESSDLASVDRPLEVQAGTPRVLPPQQEQVISAAAPSILTPGCIAAIVFGVLISLVVILGVGGFMIWQRRTQNRPKVLGSDQGYAGSDSGGYIDDQVRVSYVNSQTESTKGSPEDLISLDNDSFLNSLESMTIQNLWTDNIRHTKL